jgi:hypothetical protein
MYKGVSIPPRGQSSPLGVKFTPRAKLHPPSFGIFHSFSTTPKKESMAVTLKMQVALFLKPSGHAALFNFFLFFFGLTFFPKHILITLLIYQILTFFQIFITCKIAYWHNLTALQFTLPNCLKTSAVLERLSTF